MIRYVLALMALLASPALAHNIIASVFPSGDAIEGEIGFSDGTMAADQLVEVWDKIGTKLGETRTDDDGFFLFTPSQPVTHIFRANLGSGHIAEATMTGMEVANLMGVAAAKESATASTFSPSAMGKDTLDEATRAEIAKMLRDEIRPLRQEITAYRNKNDLQTILGGIGYIVGLFGLGFYIAARRKLEGDK